MKNVAKCDTWCELQNPVNHRVFERKFRPKPSGRGHVCLGVTNRRPPILSRIWDGSWSPVCYRTRLAKIRAKDARSVLTCGGEFISRQIVGHFGPIALDDPKSSTRPQVRRDHPLSLSISISRGKETNKDSLREASSATDRAQVPWKGAPGRVRAPSCPDLVAPRGAVYEWGCLRMQPQSGGKFRPRLNMDERPIANKYREGVGLWAPHSTRLETQTQESDMCANQRFECEHACREPEDGELCLSGAKQEETLVEAHSDTDVKIVHLTWVGRGGCFVEPSHGIESSKWAIFGKQNWRCGMNQKPGYGAQLRANLEPTKGVGRLRQQDGGHGSQNTLRSVRPIPGHRGKSQALMSKRARRSLKNLGREPGRSSRRLPTLETAQPEVGSNGWKSTARRVVSGAFPADLENPEDRVPLTPGVPIPNPSTVGGLLEPLTCRERTASCRLGGRTRNGSYGSFLRASNSQLITAQCSECQSEEIQLSAGKRREETTAKGTGFAESAGKEDPVELDSSPTFTNMKRESVADRSFRPSEFDARGVRKVTTGITGLWQPSVHSDVAF
ncbi:hypothetical protein YC2023_098711 [Brassica napus]